MQAYVASSGPGLGFCSSRWPAKTLLWTGPDPDPEPAPDHERLGREVPTSAKGLSTIMSTSLPFPNRACQLPGDIWDQETTGASPHAWSSSAVAPANRQLSMGLGCEEGHSVLVTSCVSRASNKLGLCSAPTHGKGEIGARLEVGRLDDAGAWVSRCSGVIKKGTLPGHRQRRSRGRRKREQLDCFFC